VAAATGPDGQSTAMRATDQLARGDHGPVSWLGRRNVRPPPDVFAAVMATGIVSIAAEEHGPSVLTYALTVVAVAAFASALVWTTRAAALRPIVAVRDRRDLDWLLRSFTFVAACTVLAARFAAITGLDWVLGAAAAAAWLVLAVLAVSQVRTRSPVELRDQAHGAWLLASVATSGLAARDLGVSGDWFAHCRASVLDRIPSPPIPAGHLDSDGGSGDRHVGGRPRAIGRRGH
jgi:hypothetical protein